MCCLCVQTRITWNLHFLNILPWGMLACWFYTSSTNSETLFHYLWYAVVDARIVVTYPDVLSSMIIIKYFSITWVHTYAHAHTHAHTHTHSCTHSATRWWKQEFWRGKPGNITRQTAGTRSRLHSKYCARPSSTSLHDQLHYTFNSPRYWEHQHVTLNNCHNMGGQCCHSNKHTHLLLLEMHDVIYWW